MKIKLGFLGILFVLLIAACTPPQDGTISIDETNTFLTQPVDSISISTETPALSLPTATFSPTASPTQPQVDQTYCDWVAFVKDVSIPDGSVQSPGNRFVKTWRLKNIGSCTWTAGYSLVFNSGHQMSGPSSIALPTNVTPGETIDISVALTTPATEGRYTGYWMLQNAAGDDFGYGDQANKPFFVAILSAQQTNTSKSLLEWQSNGGSPCEKAIFSAEDLAFGACAGELMKMSSQNSGQTPRLMELVNTYASFTAQTAAGVITLNGTGMKNATQAEQRAIAEWARLEFQIAQAGRAGAAWGWAFSWHREGGIAGFCDDVTVYITGLTSISNCTGLNRQLYLNASQLEQVYGWIDTLKTIDYSYTDTGIADAMTITLVLSGKGNQDANQADIQAISNFASNLIASASVSGDGYPPGGVSLTKIDGPLSLNY